MKEDSSSHTIQYLHSQSQRIDAESQRRTPLNGLHARDIHSSVRAERRAHKPGAPRGNESFCVYGKNQYPRTNKRFNTIKRFPGQVATNLQLRHA